MKARFERMQTLACGRLANGRSVAFEPGARIGQAMPRGGVRGAVEPLLLVGEGGGDGGSAESGVSPLLVEALAEVPAEALEAAFPYPAVAFEVRLGAYLEECPVAASALAQAAL